MSSVVVLREHSSRGWPDRSWPRRCRTIRQRAPAMPRATGDAPTRPTYRVQVRPGFDLDATAATRRLPADLGVGHPLQLPAADRRRPAPARLRRGRPRRVNPELGGEAGRQRLRPAPARHGLGLVVDIVPNHVGVAVPAAEPAWWDVLRRRRDSAYADWFDIDWDAGGRLLLPVLGDDLDDAWTTRTWRRRGAALPRAPLPVADGTGDGTARRGARPAALRAGRLAARRRRAELPPVLRHRRPWPACGWRTRRCSTPPTREILRWVAAGRGRRPPGRPPGRPARPRRLPGRLPSRRAAPGCVVEKILEHGEELPATGRSTAPPATTRSPRSAGSSSTRPARRPSTALDDRAAPAAHGRWHDADRTTPSGASPTPAARRRARAGWPRDVAGAAAVARPAAPARRSPSCSPRSPVYRTYRRDGAASTSTGARAEAGRRRARPGAATLDALTPAAAPTPTDDAGACGSSSSPAR